MRQENIAEEDPKQAISETTQSSSKELLDACTVADLRSQLASVEDRISALQVTSKQKHDRFDAASLAAMKKWLGKYDSCVLVMHLVSYSQEL